MISVKPGTPQELERPHWGEPNPLDGPSPTPQPSVTPLPAIQLKSPKDGPDSLFKTPILMPDHQRAPQDMFADPVPGSARLVVEQQMMQHPGPPTPQQMAMSPSPGTPRGVQSPVMSSPRGGEMYGGMSGPPSVGSTGYSPSDPYARPVLTPHVLSEDPYAHPVMTPRSVSQDPYAHPPSTPGTPQDPYSRPPSTPRPLDEQFIRLPGGPRPPQEQYGGPRFPSPAPRMAVPFSAGSGGQMHRPPHLMQGVNPYTRPPMTPRGPLPPQQLPSDPYAQQPATPGPAPHTAATMPQLHNNTTVVSAPVSTSGVGLQPGPGTVAEMHPEMQQMLVTAQRFPGGPHGGHHPPGPLHPGPHPGMVSVHIPRSSLTSGCTAIYAFLGICLVC